MRLRFDKSIAIDGKIETELRSMVRNHSDPYTDAESELLRDGMANFAKFHSLNAKKLAMASPSTKAKIAFEKGNAHAWGSVKVEVRANPEQVRASASDLGTTCVHVVVALTRALCAQVLAFVLNHQKRSERRLDHEEKTARVVNDHHRELYIRFRPTSIIRGRDFYNRQVWRKTHPDTFVVVGTPMESDAHAVSAGIAAGVVRGRTPLFLKLRGAGRRTTVECTSSPFPPPPLPPHPSAPAQT
jgi:hypothetical protein